MWWHVSVFPKTHQKDDAKSDNYSLFLKIHYGLSSHTLILSLLSSSTHVAYPYGRQAVFLWAVRQSIPSTRQPYPSSTHSHHCQALRMLAVWKGKQIEIAIIYFKAVYLYNSCDLSHNTFLAMIVQPWAQIIGKGYFWRMGEHNIKCQCRMFFFFFFSLSKKIFKIVFSLYIIILDFIVKW